VGYFEKQLAAYQKLWSRLGPTSYDTAAGGLLVVQEGDRYFLDVGNARRFFAGFRTFFYSEHGIFLSRELRKLLFGIRDLVEETIAAAPDPAAARVPLSRKARRRLQWEFDRVRVLVRQDLGMSEVGLPRFEDDGGS
jgi:hypothetical protein